MWEKYVIKYTYWEMPSFVTMVTTLRNGNVLFLDTPTMPGMMITILHQVSI